MAKKFLLPILLAGLLISVLSQTALAQSAPAPVATQTTCSGNLKHEDIHGKPYDSRKGDHLEITDTQAVYSGTLGNFTLNFVGGYKGTEVPGKDFLRTATFTKSTSSENPDLLSLRYGAGAADVFLRTEEWGDSEGTLVCQTRPIKYAKRYLCGAIYKNSPYLIDQIIYPDSTCEQRWYSPDNHAITNTGGQIRVNDKYASVESITGLTEYGQKCEPANFKNEFVTLDGKLRVKTRKPFEGDWYFECREFTEADLPRELDKADKFDFTVLLQSFESPIFAKTP